MVENQKALKEAARGQNAYKKRPLEVRMYTRRGR